ncbi:N-acetyltransferase [Robertmurraya sp. DFI.2.37]|uniref:GNAT family N-acetyltransferase n=1 Tax=Robertmurraya sp. DFI.2.37 TaxID=3031819 RepID=UPI001248225F|nr:N-acetyltransferase [Robertmurraya sp. DFI.2.37]MDF1507143.1 N-acetyltransferase [Robertmurraya sp. DFI.2.37]
MIEIRRVKEIDEVSTFISKMNLQPTQHVGYCGTDSEEIKHALSTDFSDLAFADSVIGAFQNRLLIGVLGLDIDMESKEAEVWGPFIDHSEWQKVAEQMWKKLIEDLPSSLEAFYGFYNVHNVNGSQFMDSLGAVKSGEHSILQISTNHLALKTVTPVTIREMKNKDFQHIRFLHKASFPNAYFSADEMIDMHGEKQKIFVAELEQHFCGYIFCEAEPKFAEGNIHFIAVSPAFRNRRIGRDLIIAGLKFLFSFQEIEVITLTVKSDNEAALNVYLHAGFIEKHRLYSYHGKI